MADSTYDFIVVGSGPAGASLAWRLANNKTKPSVLVIEAGGANSDQEWRISGNRWVDRMNPERNYHYKTAPQEHVDNREIDFDRGRGLGGSSGINFCCYNVGPRDDHDEIARLTGDDCWKWQSAKEAYKVIESFHGFVPEIPPAMERYLNPKRENHGSSGPIHIGFPDRWEPTLTYKMDIWAQSGYDLRADLGDGSGLGLAVCPSSAYRGLRSTAADMILNGPDNLEIIVNTTIHKVFFEGNKAIGVLSLDGKSFHASKEVILSAGTLDTPKIILHSGIGPPDQLAEFNIQLTHSNAAVGENLADHIHISPTWERKPAPETEARVAWFRSPPETKAAALKQWQTDRTGLLAEICANNAMGFFKAPAVFASAEFARLPEPTKRFLQASTVPSYEILLDSPAIEDFVDPANAKPYASVFVFLLNGQSRGTARLQSGDPRQPLRFDPRFLSHEYDRRVAVEATREVLKVVAGPAFAGGTVGPSPISGAPASDSDEDILAYWRQHLGSTWHMTGTCKMGRDQHADQAVVDTEFRVFGVQGLRVADMSVVPILPNNHTQSTAYLVGVTLGDKLIQEYGLDA